MNNERKLNLLFLKIDFKKVMKSFINDYLKMPLFLLLHPILGFDEFKREHKSKQSVAIFYLVMMVFTQIISYNGQGYLVNKNDPKDFNIFLTISLVLFPLLIIVIANWATAALIDGKGTMTDIFRMLCYSFFPYVWISLFATLFSNYITLDEIAFFTFFQSFSALLLCYMAFFGLMGIHENGLLKNILMILFTILTIAIILFVMLLFLSLIQEVYAYFKSVFEEFTWRFLQ